MDTKHFSFPRISENCAFNIDSPPLWDLSPAGSPNPFQFPREEKIGDEEKDCYEEAKLISQCQRKKSFSEVAKKALKKIDEENKMDLLWEDFNEELPSTTGSTSSSSSSPSSSSSREVAEFKCAPTLKVANKNNGVLLPNKKNKPGMMVIVKVLKKLFLNNSQRTPRKRKH